MKKVLIGIVAVLAVFIGILLVVPLFYSIDSLRPQIQAAVEKQVRGKVTLGKLSLRLFPDVRVSVDGVTATPPAPYDKEPLAKLDGFAVSLPLMSFLTGPQATIVVDKPAVLLITQGKESNLSAFLPEADRAEAESAAKPATPAKAGGLDETLSALPPWIANRVRAARLSVDVKNAAAEVRNLDAPSKNDHTIVHDLNLKLHNIGIAAPIEIALDLVTDVKSGDVIVKGPIRSKGNVTFTPEGKGFKLALDLDQDLNDLDAKFSNLFHKKPGIALGAGIKGVVTQGAESMSADLPQLEFRFGGFTMKGAVGVTDANLPEKARVKASLASGDTSIAPFAAIVPMIGDYKLEGKFGLNVTAEGPMADPTVDVDVRLDGIKGATPQLKKPVSDLTGRIEVKGTAKNPSVRIDPLRVKIGASDISLKVETKGLENISANVALSSNRMDADELLGLQALKLDKKLTKEEQKQHDAEVEAAKKAPIVPMDQALDQMAPTLEEQLKNPMLDKVAATIKLDFKSIKALGAEFTNATLNLAYLKRQLTISRTGIGGYGGRVDLSGDLGLRDPAAPTFDFKAGLDNVKLEEVTKAHAPTWNKTVAGAMTGNFSITGKGLRKEQIAQNLGGGLRGDVKNGMLDLPVTKLVAMVMDKLPAGVGKKAEGAAKGKEHSGKFKTMKIVSVIKGRVIELQDLDVMYEPDGTSVGDLRFQAKGTVNFDQIVDLTGIAYMSPDIVRVNELKGPSGKIEIPLKMKGTLKNPEPDLGYSLGVLGPRVAKNALEGRLGQEGKKQLQKAAAPVIDKLEKKAPKKAKKAIKDLKKKFGF